MLSSDLKSLSLFSSPSHWWLLNTILPRFPEIQSHLNFHMQFSVVTLSELFNRFCSLYTVPYFYETRIVYNFICRENCSLAFSSSRWNSVWREYGIDFVGEGRSFGRLITTEEAAGINSALHLMGTAVESVLMAEGCTMCLCVQKHGSSYENPVKILFNIKVDDRVSPLFPRLTFLWLAVFIPFSQPLSSFLLSEEKLSIS